MADAAKAVAGVVMAVATITERFLQPFLSSKFGLDKKPCLQGFLLS
jgi:hypothetical protein